LIKLTGLHARKRPDRDPSPIEVMKFCAAIGAADDVIGDSALFGSGQLAIEIGGEQFTEVAVREQPAGDLEVREHAQGLAHLLDAAELLHRLLFTGKDLVDKFGLLGGQLTIEEG
jgi:hypothetical protein